MARHSKSKVKSPRHTSHISSSSSRSLTNWFRNKLFKSYLWSVFYSGGIWVEMRFLPLVRKNISSEDVKWKYPRKITTRRSDSSPGRRVEINLTSACHFSLDEIILRNELLIKNMTKPINSTHNWVPWSGIKLAWVEYAVCGWDKSKANETCPTSPSFESSSSTWAAHSKRERNEWYH